MGNSPQPNYKPKRVSKTQVEIACLKVKAHLQLVKDRKSAEVIKAEKTMVGLVKGSSRNKTEEILQAEKIINDLKYIQACTTLIAYSNTLRNFAGMIAESGGQASKIQELMTYIYSIMYASKFLGLFSLNEFREMMLSFFGTEAIPIDNNLVDPKIQQCFQVKPTPFQLNTYFLQMGQRNNIGLEKINQIHQFSNNPVYTPPVPAQNPMNNIPNPYNPNQQPNQQQGFNPYGQPMGPVDRNSYPITSQFFNDPFAPGPNQHNNVPFSPPGNPYQNGPNNMNGPGNGGQNQPNMPDFFVPPPVMPIPTPTVAKTISKPPVQPPIQPPVFNNFDDIRLNDINKIEDIPMYPEMNFDFKNPQPGGMRNTQAPIQANQLPQIPSIISPVLPTQPNIPTPNGFPDLNFPANPFPAPTNEFIPGGNMGQQGPSKVPLWGPPGPSNQAGFDANFEQICEEIRKGL